MRFARSLTAVCAILIGVSCDTARGTVAPAEEADRTPAELTSITPTTATGTVSAELELRPGARVANKLGLPIAGITVTFRVESGGGSANPATVTSDSLGRAATTWTLGPNAGPQTLTASVGNLTPVTFTATATAAGVSSITRVAGNGQVATVGKAIATSPAVILTDPNGNPVPNIEVTFAVASGGGTITGAATRTDKDGIARAGTWTLGTTAGTNTLTASAAGNLSTTFDATGTPDTPTSMTMTTTDTVELRVGSRFKVKAHAFDRYGNENIAAAITYSVSPAQNGTVDREGNVVALAAGPLTVHAAIPDPHGATFVAAAQYQTSVIGHPLGPFVAKRLFVGADPSSVAVTDEGIFGVTATGRVGLVTRLSLDGAIQFPSIGIQTAALNFLIVAPKRGGGTAVVTNIGTISSSYWFLDVETNTIVDSITTTRYVQGAAMTADGSRAYFLLDAGELAVLDMATHEFLPSIPLGGGVTSFRPAPGDTIAYARSTVGTMLEIDLRRGVVRRQFNFPAYADVEPSRDLSQFYVIDAPSGVVRVLRASDLSQQFSYVTDATHIALPPDSKAMFLSVGDRVEVATGDVANGFYPTARYTTSGVPSRVLFSTDGSVAVVPNANGWIDIIR